MILQKRSYTVASCKNNRPTQGRMLEGAVCLVSGSVNVAQDKVEKLLDLEAKPLTLSDSNGYIYDESGISLEKLAYFRIRSQYLGYVDLAAMATSYPDLEMPENTTGEYCEP